MERKLDYCTPQNMINEYGQKKIAQATGDASGVTVNTDILQKYIDAGKSEIDSYLRKRISLPLAEPVPVILKSLNMEIAWYQMKKKRFGSVSESDVSLYESNVKYLDKVASGKIDIGAVSETVDEESPDFKGSFYSKPRLFGGYR
jgi:phage gp36-like protein